MQQWIPSEQDAPLRNDGRSIHHRAELEKRIAQFAEKIAELKKEIGELEASPSECGKDAALPIGGS
jgi:hypothetical protein